MGCLFEKGVIVLRRKCLFEKGVIASEGSTCLRKEHLFNKTA